MTGYQHPNYAQSLAEWGAVRELPRSGGWLLERQIPGSPHVDAMGPYPLFACRDWARLHADLDALDGQLVSVSLVADPFGSYDEATLHRCFPDRVVRFKEHFVVDLKRPVGSSVCRHHCRYARRALRRIAIETSNEPREWLDDWHGLYDVLSERHGISGIRAFSREAFAAQLEVPGIVAVRALRDGVVLGMNLWFVHGGAGYYHLGASSDDGYRDRVSFGIYWASIEHFAERGLAWLDLGGGAGVNADGEDGLAQFKRGWTSETRHTYFCGRILDRMRYKELCTGATDYFPAYRAGEFG